VDALSIRPDYAADAVRRVATYTSPPLGDIVADINRESLNLYAEQLLRTLAVERAADSTRQGPPVGSAEDGVRRVKTTLAQAAIDTARVQQVDGSGLSRMNLVSARALVRLLTYMDDHPQPAVRRAFRASLPVGGQDGTLEYRFPSYAPASANVRAKTGTLSNAIALSGYVTAADGTPLAFSLLCNHYIADGSVVRAAQDAVVNALARYRRPAATPPADRQ
jgi:D-alanyl-D-alanine carboxypeptidase/D-alanyl-D-alanine-endopeptidase (penicillin-binding protein 4)